MRSTPLKVFVVILLSSLVAAAFHSGGPAVFDSAAAAPRKSKDAKIKSKSQPEKADKSADKEADKDKAATEPPADVKPTAGNADPSTAQASPATEASAAAPATSPAEAPESVEADVSTRSVAVKLGFTGTEIIVFGSVHNSRQPSAEAGYYDVIVALEGQPTPIVARRKSNVAGLWMNTPSLAFAFDRVPSYYAIASTRPIDEIAEPEVLAENAIGFDYVKIRPRQGRVRTVSEEIQKDYRDAVVRLKQDAKLYFEADYDVAFIGRSLFRTTIRLPANIAVGPLDVRVYLFREGKLLNQYESRVTLERAGIELWLHGFANHYPLSYGIFTVVLAVCAGLLASAFFRRDTA